MRVAVAAVVAGVVAAVALASTEGHAHRRHTTRDTPHVASPPNVVIILTDDQPTQTLWAMPQTKRFVAAHGVKFMSFYDSVAVCCPARSALLTGRYAHSTGVYANDPPFGGAPTFHNRGDDRSTLPVWLHGAGYRTGLFGKYLNGYAGRFVPLGWDKFITSSRYWGGIGYVQGVKTDFPQTTYMPAYLGQKTAKFIRSTPRGVPLFAYYAPFAPHGHPNPQPRYAHMRVCWACHGWPTPDFDERDVSDKPAFERRPPFSPSEVQAIHRFRTLQLQTLQSVDVAVGRIVRALRDTGRLHNTVFVFTSDNGVMWGSHRWPGPAKSNPYKRASRMPLVIRYDRLGTTPRVERRLVSNIDIAPTLAALAGAPVPTPVDGVSFAPILRDRHKSWSQTLLIEHIKRPSAPTGRGPTYCGVRTDAYLFLHHSTGSEELYDERRDPFELKNIAGKARIAAVEGRLRRETRRLCSPPPPGFRF